MKQIFAKLALAGMIGLTGFGATLAPAAADTLTLGIHSGGVVDVQYRDRDRDRYGDERDWDRDRDRRYRPGWGHERRGRCDPRLAADKARANGLRRARVVDVSPRRVVVEGRRWGEYRRVVFANARGCPYLGR
jgi:hypothetical protein